MPVSKAPFVKMLKSDLIAEHVKLLNVLKSGSKAALMSEYNMQSKELKKYLPKPMSLAKGRDSEKQKRKAK